MSATDGRGPDPMADSDVPIGKTAASMSNRVVPEFTRQRYLQTVVTIEVDGTWLDAADAVGQLPTPVYVITAHDPGPVRLSKADNQARHEQLRQQLVNEGFEHHHAVGSTPAGVPVDEGWAVTGIGPKRARRLGRAWGQDAIFELTDTEQRVVGCASRWVRSRPLASPPVPVGGVDLVEAVSDALGIDVEPEFLRAFEPGWGHDGDLRLPCPQCGGALHLFGADLESKAKVPYRSMAFVCVDEAAVSLPNRVPADYRAVAKSGRHVTLAKADADEAGLTERTNWAYVIELNDEVGDREGSERPWVYVGETGLTPEVRFEQHRAGHKASRWVKRYGVRLRPDLYADQPPLRSKAESVAYEAWLFAYLKATGWPVKGGI